LYPFNFISLINLKRLILGDFNLTRMQDHKKSMYKKIFLLSLFSFVFAGFASAQVSSVIYGRNRVQYKKFKWQYYQTRNFNSYFNQDGQELGKFVAQVAEEELPGIERFVDFNLERRVNILIYNSFGDMKQTNVGLGNDAQVAGGLTKLVNNKMIVYFNGNHDDLRRQIREGIAGVLVQNLLFGEDLGEVAGNAALLDLPQWLTDGYIAYAGQNWSTKLDDELKNEILSGKYKNFNQFAFDKPLLAGHAFWFFIEEKYKRENTTYLLYLARIYKSLKKATEQVTHHKNFNDLLSEFMKYEGDKYDNDISRRKNNPKGSEIEDFTVSKQVNYYHFNVNPNKRNYSYSVVKYKRGQYRVIYNDGYDDKTLLKFGVKNQLDEINPNYPIIAWDPKGTRLAVLYEDESRIQFFVYDVITKVKPYKRDLTKFFDQVLDMKYMINSQTLLLSAVKNGRTNIYVYDIENDKIRQITDDVYDELDPSFVAFPNKTGILFSSNRPSANARGGDTSLMPNRFNIFMVTDFDTKNAASLNQITQLTNLKFGDARYPTQYSNTHFTFESDLNGIGNRYAGYFTSTKDGLDTVVIVGDQILRNPTADEVDSLLKTMHRTDVDSIAVVSVSKDSAVVFPLTNYSNSLLESREAGEDRQVSEVTRQDDDKILYKLKIDENALRRRNVNARPSDYMEKKMAASRISQGEEITAPVEKQEDDIFQHEFKRDTAVSMTLKSVEKNNRPDVLSTAAEFSYKPMKFATDYIVAGFNNNVLGTQYQVYEGGAGPITLTSNNGLNGIVNVGAADLMEDIKISGGFRLSTNLKNNDWIVQFSNLRKRLDWGLMYYKRVSQTGFSSGTNSYPGNIFSGLFQASLSYPLDEVRSIRANFGVRRDNVVVSAVDQVSLAYPNSVNSYGLTHIEYVYDNTLNPVQNIWDGIRYKVYMDWNSQLNHPGGEVGRNMFNFGFDGRVYHSIYRNFIWAGRVAGDFSWGAQKYIYYVGGIDNWFMFSDNQKVNKDGSISYRYFNPANQPAPDQSYAFQTLAVNLRGFIQNAANGNNNVIINSEFRLPVFTTFMDNPINNAFIRNFQLTQFIDLGTAWNGAYNAIGRPSITYTDSQDPTVTVKIKAPGVGPFLGGYGFGARSTLLGYFLKVDVGWPMSGFFNAKPILYFSMGFDF